MAAGMEAMIKSILKAFGVDPETLRAEIEGRLAQFEMAVKNMDGNLQNINAQYATISQKLGMIQWRLERMELREGFIAGEIPIDETVRDPNLKPQSMELIEHAETESENHGRRGSRN